MNLGLAVLSVCVLRFLAFPLFLEFVKTYPVSTVIIVGNWVLSSLGGTIQIHKILKLGVRLQDATQSII